MIRALVVTDPKMSATPWWASVDALKELPRIDFKPGLNILWGRNGGGKSTVLKTLARLLHCEQGGRSLLTRSSIDGLFPTSFKAPKENLFGITLEHDGKPAMFVDPTQKIGLLGGSFDDDFFSEGMASLSMSKISSGQEVIVRMNQLFKSIFDTPWPIGFEMTREMNKSHVNSLWVERIERVEASLAANIEPDPPTVLLDEPDRSLDIDNQAALWGTLLKASEKVQIITASHNVAAIFAPGANYIELTPGYLTRCRGVFASLRETWIQRNEPKPEESRKESESSDA